MFCHKSNHHGAYSIISSKPIVSKKNNNKKTLIIKPMGGGSRDIIKGMTVKSLKFKINNKNYPTNNPYVKLKGKQTQWTWSPFFNLNLTRLSSSLHPNSIMISWNYLIQNYITFGYILTLPYVRNSKVSLKTQFYILDIVKFQLISSTLWWFFFITTQKYQ